MAHVEGHGHFEKGVLDSNAPWALAICETDV